MKNCKILIIALLFGYFGQSQVFDDGIITGPYTTTQINAIVSPQEGRQVYNSTTKTVWLYNGTIWVDTGDIVGTDDQIAAEVPVDDASFDVITGTDAQAAFNSTDNALLASSSTGIKDGGNLSDLGLGVVRITAGNGTILNNAIPSVPVYSLITWVQTDIDLSITDQVYYIYVNNLGVVTSTTTEPSHSEYRTGIYLWRVSIRSGLVSGVSSIVQPLQQYGPQIWDIWSALGYVKDGLDITAASTNLTLATAAGVIYLPGSNFYTDPLNPHEITITANSPLTFRMVTQNGTQGVDVVNLPVANYDLNNVITPISGAATRATVFSVYLFPGSDNYRIFYGQTVFNNVSEAYDALQTGEYTETVPSSYENAARLGWIVAEKGATNLGDGIQIFVTSNKFGGVGGSISSPSVGSLLAANNLGDLSDVPTAQINLGKIDDDTFATATATNFPSSESVKAYVDNVGVQNLSEVLSQGNITGINNIDFESNGSIIDAINIASSTASIATLNGTNAFLSGNLELSGGYVDVEGEVSSKTGFLKITDIEPIGVEGRSYADNSENRPKYYDGTSWKAFVLDGDVLSNIVEDLTPQLGGFLDANDFSIQNASSLTIKKALGSKINIANSSNLEDWSFGNDLSPTGVVSALGDFVLDYDSDNATNAEATWVFPKDDIADNPNDVLRKKDGDLLYSTGTDSGQVLSPTTKSTGLIETYDNSDVTNLGGATAERKWNKHTTNDTILLGTGITRYNQPWLETLSGADSLYIKKDVATTFYIADSVAAISADGLILKGGRKSATIIAESSDVFYIAGEVSVYNEPLIAPIYQGFNAADPVNEVDGIANMNVSAGSATITSVETAPTPQNGTSSLVFERTSAITTRVQFLLGDIGVGDSFEISIWAQELVGTEFQIQTSTVEGWTTGDNTTFTTAGGWTQYTFAADVVNSTDVRIRIVMFGALGDKIAFDNLVITKI